MKQNNCQTSTDRSLNQGQPILEFVKVTIPAGATTIGIDIPVHFNVSHTFFMVVSILQSCSDAMVCISVAKQNYNNLGLVLINPTGGEQWIPLSNKQNSSGRVEGRWIKFETAIQDFFITADHPTSNPVAGNYPITILGTDDIEAVISERT